MQNNTACYFKAEPNSEILKCRIQFLDFHVKNKRTALATIQLKSYVKSLCDRIHALTCV